MEIDNGPIKHVPNLVTFKLRLSEVKYRSETFPLNIPPSSVKIFSETSKYRTDIIDTYKGECALKRESPGALVGPRVNLMGVKSHTREVHTKGASVKGGDFYSNLFL